MNNINIHRVKDIKYKITSLGTNGGFYKEIIITSDDNVEFEITLYADKVSDFEEEEVQKNGN